MKYSTPKYPLIQLPKKIEMILFLIREELKSEKHFSLLENVGVVETQYQPHLCKLILLKMGLDDGSDVVFQKYYEIIERRKKKVSGKKSLVKQVMKVYMELSSTTNKRFASAPIAK